MMNASGLDPQRTVGGKHMKLCADMAITSSRWVSSLEIWLVYTP